MNHFPCQKIHRIFNTFKLHIFYVIYQKWKNHFDYFTRVSNLHLKASGTICIKKKTN